MSLRKINFKGLGPRLILSTTLLLFLSLTVVSSIIYFLLASSLRQNDLYLLQRLSHSYATVFQNSGMEALSNEISPEIMVSIHRKDGSEIFSKMPLYIDHDFEDEDEIKQLKDEAAKIPLKKGLQTILLLSGEENNDLFQKMEYQLRLFALEKNWVAILPIIDNDLIEVYVSPLGNGTWMKVGRSFEEREEHLASIRYIAFIVFIPFIFIGIALSALMARSVLKPIRDLAGTIRAVSLGNQAARGKVRGAGDEIDVLTGEFNKLLDKNDVLIKNIKSTVDNVAHDLRTPLTRIRSSAEYALINKSDPEQLKEALQDALENSDQILEMLKAIMDVAEAETQTMKIKSKPIQLQVLIHRLMEFFQMLADEKEITLINNIDPDISILGDETRLLQAFSNLIDNAIKYSPNGTTVTIEAKIENQNVQIYFIDQGMGIDQEDLPKIWDRLYRADRSRSTPGTGIGLSLVKAIIQVHQGQVEVKSQPVGGTTFIVTLPLCNDAERLS